jgi:flagellar basal-body rod protein FlgG
MRALWTSASGMRGMQTRLDVIAHNVANVNTAGYKAKDVAFKDALYQQMQQKPEETSLPRRETEAGLRIGHGVVPVDFTMSFTQGYLQRTDRNLDIALEGQGFLTVGIYDAQGNRTGVAYTRNGAMEIGYDRNTGESYLVDGNARPLLDVNGDPIRLTGYDVTKLQITTKGELFIVDGQQRTPVAQLEVVRVANPEINLESAGENLFALKNTAAPNVVTPQAYNAANNPVTVKQGMIEQSNVELVSQFTEMMVAQRVYSMNVRALQTTDQMMGIANGLRS